MFIVGIDLGRRQDYTAISVIDTGVVRGELWLRELNRFPLGTEYPAIEEGIADLVRALPGRPVLVVDGTGVGDAVVAHLRGTVGSLAEVVSVWITSGSKVNGEKNDFRVPKVTLAGALRLGLEGGTLKFAKGLPDLAVLLDELKNFTSKITPSGNEVLSSDWRTGVHDDLVLSVAMAVWFAGAGPRRISVSMGTIAGMGAKRR